MKSCIKYDSENGIFRYWDCEGNELHDGDVVKTNDGSIKKLYLTDQGTLGTDATNPSWIESGKAVPCEYGVYPLEDSDMSGIVKV